MIFIYFISKAKQFIFILYKLGLKIMMHSANKIKKLNRFF